MLDAGFISARDAETAIATPVRISPPPAAGAPYFVDRAIDEARLASGGVDADLIVRTTIAPPLQDALEAGLSAGVALAKLDPTIEVAGVILDSDGAVRALAGGRDYQKSQFNRATDARRQPGSAFKPFVFLAAIEAGMAPGDLVEDAPIAIGAWSPRNFNNKYYGEVSVAEAMARSLNGATVRLQEYAGRENVRRVARRMGVSSPLSRTPALALGVDAMSPVELAGAYAPFANGGMRVAPHTVDRIDLADGRSLYRAPDPFRASAASADAIRAANAMLAGVVEWGTGRAAGLAGAQAFGKTGTTQGSRDAWFAGHAGGLVCVIWIGRDDFTPMGDMTGGKAPAVIWREIMERALIIRPPPQPLPPALSPAVAG
jgi:penicillin-binding protein 1A